MEEEFRFSILTILILSLAAIFAAAQENTEAKGIDKSYRNFYVAIYCSVSDERRSITHWSYGSLVESVMDPDGKSKVIGLVAEITGYTIAKLFFIIQLIT